MESKKFTFELIKASMWASKCGYQNNKRDGIYLILCDCSFHCCVFCLCCSSLFIYLYRSLGLCAGDVGIVVKVWDGAPKFGIVLAKVIDARRLLKIGDFERLMSYRI